MHLVQLNFHNTPLIIPTLKYGYQHHCTRQQTVTTRLQCSSQPHTNTTLKFSYSCTMLKNLTPWPQSASELYRPRDHCLSTKLVPTFANRGCNMVSVTVPYGRILGFLGWSRYFFFQVARQLYYSRGWVYSASNRNEYRKKKVSGKYSPAGM
jgi:hypothetical protein